MNNSAMSLIERINRAYKNGGIRELATRFPNFVKYQLKPMMVDSRSILSIRSRTCEIYSEDWDLLIVLDACRYDVMDAVADEYSFIQSVGSRYSPASSSLPWLRYQFHPKHIQRIKETAYITGNVFSDEVLDESDFYKLDEVWKYCWNEDIGVVPPRAITDQAINTARNSNMNQMIVHYMQPHFPSLDNPELGGQIDRRDNKWINDVWSKLEAGEINKEVVWNAYKSNLESVLSEVELLLNNSEFSKAVITSDHGNAFGERGIYGHPGNRVHSCLRKVPWIVTSANDIRTHMPETEDESVDEISIDDKLSALGYV